MSLILGIDPGSIITGYGLIESTGKDCIYKGSGCLQASAKNMSIHQRLYSIYQGLQEIIKTYHPSVIALENIFLGSNVHSVLKLGEVRGACIIAGSENNLKVFEYTATQVKKTISGNGRSSKTQVMIMVMNLLKIYSKPQVDASDALAIAICHAHTYSTLSV